MGTILSTIKRSVGFPDPIRWESVPVVWDENEIMAGEYLLSIPRLQEEESVLLLLIKYRNCGSDDDV